jgi:hypothetical protein
MNLFDDHGLLSIEIKLSVSWNGDGGANAAYSAFRSRSEPFLLRTERMLAESGESGVSRLSPVRCGRKERHISRGVSAFSNM